MKQKKCGLHPHRVDEAALTSKRIPPFFLLVKPQPPHMVVDEDVTHVRRLIPSRLPFHTVKDSAAIDLQPFKPNVLHRPLSVIA